MTDGAYKLVGLGHVSTLDRNEFYTVFRLTFLLEFTQSFIF
jgi:hypothetical protein